MMGKQMLKNIRRGVRAATVLLAVTGLIGAVTAGTARAADGVEMVGVRAKSKRPSRSLTLSAPKTRIGTVTPARRRTIPSSMSAHASMVAPACSSASATRPSPCP